MTKHKLYGDGVSDDYPAIQQLLDLRLSAVELPVPAKHYLISKTLKIHSDQMLKLSRHTLIMLKENSNCLMVENAQPHKNSNITIEGGIWDMNHSYQWPNPYHFENEHGKKFSDFIQQTNFDVKTSKYFADIYTGHAMRFCGVRNLHVKDLTIKNPVVYGVQIGYTQDFTFENIYFDYTEGSPKLWNMDGIHVEGHCKNGVLRNLKGACHDDLVALTADDGLYGPIENIVIDGIFAENSHSAVRLLSHGIPVKNIRISNIFGSFYTYCIGVTKYYGGDDEIGIYENIVIDNVFASSCEGTKDVYGGNYPFIFIQKGLYVRNMYISNVMRDEKTYPQPMIKVESNVKIGELHLHNIRQKSYLGCEIPLLSNDGEILELIQSGVKNEY